MSKSGQIHRLTPRGLRPVAVECVQRVGEVTEPLDRGFRVRLGAEEVEARVAVSCLVSPEPGDRVLLTLGGSEHAFILAILEREDSRLAIKSEGDLSFHLPDGAFSVVAKQGVEMTTPGIISWWSDRLNANAREASFGIDTLEYEGESGHVEMGRVRFLARTIDRVAGRLTERIKDACRTVTGLDRQRAGSLDMKVENTAKIRGKNTLVTAEELMKMDGDQIHLG